MPQYYSEPLTFSIQPGVSTISVEQETGPLSSSFFFSGPLLPVGRQTNAELFCLSRLRLDQHRACFSHLFSIPVRP